MATGEGEFVAIGAGADKVDLLIVVEVGDVEHHTLNLGPHKVVHLAHSLAGLLFVEFVVGCKRYGLGKHHHHVAPHAQVVGVVVGRGQDEDLALEAALLGSTEGHFKIGLREGSEPAFVLVLSFGVEHHGFAVAERVGHLVERSFVFAHRREAVDLHTIGGQSTQPADSLAQNGILKHARTSQVARHPVRKYKNQRQGVYKAVLVILHQHRGVAIGGHIVAPLDVNLAPIDIVVHKAKIVAQHSCHQISITRFKLLIVLLGHISG